MKFNLEGLLRGDYQSRMNGYAIGRQNGWMSANDIRELENLDRIPAEDGGDLYLINGNMLPLKNAGAFADTPIDEREEDSVLPRNRHSASAPVRVSPPACSPPTAARSALPQPVRPLLPPTR